ncbi:unnamed protein product [Ixodes hexagonus]
MPTIQPGDMFTDSEMDDCTLEPQPAVSSPDCQWKKEAEAYENKVEELKRRLRATEEELKATKEKLFHAEMKLQQAKEQAKEEAEELKLVNQTVQRTSRVLELAREMSNKLEKKVGKQFSVERFKHSNEDMRFYTGLPSYAVFQSVLTFLNPGEQGENVRSWSTPQADTSEMA